MKVAVSSLSLAVGLVVLSCSVQANTNIGRYVGVEVHNTDLDIPKSTVSDLSSSTGFGVSFGVERALTQQLSFALEAEYMNFGSFDGIATISDGFTTKEVKTEIDAYGINVNVKPKYYLPGTGFYAGAIAGIGVLGVDLTLDGVADDGSNVGFNYGVEAGYEFMSGLMISGGYRASSVSIEIEGDGGDIDFDFDSFYVGLDYRF